MKPAKSVTKRGRTGLGRETPEEDIIQRAIHAARSGLPDRTPILEIRNHANGALDEIVAAGAEIHLEELRRNHWCLALPRRTGVLCRLFYHGQGSHPRRCDR
jgi:hypothetical protein